MDTAISNLINLKAISVCESATNQFISSIFLIPKPDGSKRFILNLKNLNKYVLTPHFKMEDYRTAIQMIEPNSFLAKIDLKESYLHVPVQPSDRKYLRFEYNDKLYEFNALPYGLSSAPYVFTKIMRIVVSFLRNEGFKNVIILDDILCIGSDYQSCYKNVKQTLSLLKCLGFIINNVKSSVTPSQTCQFLGFVFNSQSITLELPIDKRQSIFKIVNKYIKIKSCTIRDFAQLIGTLVAACPSLHYSWIYTKYLERHKYLALINNNNNYDAMMNLHPDTKTDLLWWARNI